MKGLVSYIGKPWSEFGNDLSKNWNNFTQRWNDFTQRFDVDVQPSNAYEKANEDNSNTQTAGMSAYDLLKDERAWSEAQAEKAFQRQKELAGSEVQMRVDDFRKAGLNPFLAYSQGGASVPSVPMASAASLAGAALGGYYTGRGQDISARLTERGQNLGLVENIINNAFDLVGIALRGSPSTSVNKSYYYDYSKR